MSPRRQAIENARDHGLITEEEYASGLSTKADLEANDESPTSLVEVEHGDFMGFEELQFSAANDAPVAVSARGALFVQLVPRNDVDGDAVGMSAAHEDHPVQRRDVGKVSADSQH